jgi:transposase-like protein
MAQLAEKYKVHPLTIRNWIHRMLDGLPPLKTGVNNLDGSYWLVTDATHFKRWGCLLVTKSTTIKHPLAVSFHDKENLTNVLQHLEPLTELSVSGCTTDGKKGLVMAYRQVFPQAKQQRCLVHIMMKVRTLLTSHPKLPIGRELVHLIQMLCPISDAVSATAWWELFAEWYEVNVPILNQRSYHQKKWWYTHRNLRKAAKHILNAADSLFVFIDQPNSVSNTNQLEGLFGQRKPALYRHRGLSRKRVASVLLWTCYMLNRKP